MEDNSKLDVYGIVFVDVVSGCKSKHYVYGRVFVGFVIRKQFKTLYVYGSVFVGT